MYLRTELKSEADNTSTSWFALQLSKSHWFQ